jgi:hypothetical protein
MGVFEFLLAKQVINLFFIMMWFIIISLGVFVYFFLKNWLKTFWNDWMILFDKDRYHVEYVKLYGMKKVEIEGNTYPISPREGFTGMFGKRLILKKFGKTDQLKMNDNLNADWIEADTLKDLLKNEDIKKIVTPKKDNSDLIIICLVLSIITIIGLVIIGLKVFNVIKSAAAA